MLYLFLHIEYLNMRDIASALKLKDNRSATKWLSDKGISVSDVGGKNVVVEFIFELKRQQLAVETLRKSYPNNWFEIYDAKTDDKGMVKAIRELYPKMGLVKKTSNKHKKKYIK